tara:strand:- start:4664 stop:5380 length:717 start_codon:yes stop_codon:yes gene_type:complete
MSTYGLQVFGEGVAAFQIDSNTTDTQHLPITHSATGTSVGAGLTNAQKAAIYQPGDIIMARPVSGSGSLCISDDAYPNFSQNADYKILSPAAGAPTNVNSSTHGLTVFNNPSTAADGSVIPSKKIFDSRSFTNSIPFNQIYGKLSFDGGPQSAGALIATNNIVLASTTQAKYDKTYTVMNGGYFVEGFPTVIHGFYFDDANNRILYHSVITFALPWYPYPVINNPIKNYGDVMIGELV